MRCAIAGGNRLLFDSSNDRRGVRMRVHKDYKTGETTVPYTSGHEFHWAKTDEGDGLKGKDHRLKEVRTLTHISTPHEVWLTNAGESEYGDKFDRIFKQGAYKEGVGGDTNGAE